MDRLDCLDCRRGRHGLPLGRRALASVLMVVLLLGGLWRLSARDDRMGILPERPADARSERIDPAVTPVVESDGYAFMARQRGSGEPVAYDPCAPIHIVVNPRTIVDGGMRMLREAVDRVMAATGLVLVVDGLVKPGERRPDATHTADGSGWNPVLVSWSDPDETPRLRGRVAGLGGSTPLQVDGHRWLVTGTVTLDGPDLGRMLRRPDGWAAARAVVMHELGHLVGLDHVEDEDQLMHPRGRTGRDSWGPGDLTGLAALGRGRCIDY